MSNVPLILKKIGLVFQPGLEITLKLRCFSNIHGLLALGPLLNIEFNLLTLFKGSVAIGFDCGVMNENIFAIFRGDKTITLFDY